MDHMPYCDKYSMVLAIEMLVKSISYPLHTFVGTVLEHYDPSICFLYNGSREADDDLQWHLRFIAALLHGNRVSGLTAIMVVLGYLPRTKSTVCKNPSFIHLSLPLWTHISAFLPEVYTGAHHIGVRYGMTSHEWDAMCDDMWEVRKAESVRADVLSLPYDERRWWVAN